MHPVNEDPEEKDEVTVVRRVNVAASKEQRYVAHRTTKMSTIDPELLALARGEGPPDTERPPSPLAAIDDPTIEIDEGWLDWDEAEGTASG